MRGNLIFSNLKGQLTSKCPFDLIKSYEKTTIFLSITLASKKGQIKKIRALYTPLMGGFLFDYLALLFLFDLSLEARSEILKNFLGFLGDLLSLNILKLTDFLKVR